MENIRHTEGSLVWSFESVGRNLHYPVLASGPLCHNDIKDTDKLSKISCPALGTNFIVGGRGRPAHVIPFAKRKPPARLGVTIIVDNSDCT